MKLLYNMSLGAYKLALYLTQPFNQKAKQMLEGRKAVWQKIAEADKTAEYLWVHCASLGEFEQGRPVIENFKAKNPNIKILLTFFSPSGYEIRKNYEGADVIIYLPFDSWDNAAQLLYELNITKAIFVKYEFWYHYLNALKTNRIPTYIVSSIFREGQTFFKWYGAWYRRMLACFTTLFVQNERSKELLASIGLDNVIVAGDTRFDRVAAIVKQAKDLPEIALFKNEKTAVVCGSTWPKDEELLIPYINQDTTDTKYIIAAHEVHASHIEAICGMLKVPYQRYTQMDKATLADAKVLVIDVIGVLSSAYRYGEIAYIGGGFGVGIHNTLEAATYGMPVLFGTNYHKFQEAKDLVAEAAAFSINNYEELSSKLDNLLSDKEVLAKSSKAAAAYVQRNTGATELILENI